MAEDEKIEKQKEVESDKIRTENPVTLEKLNELLTNNLKWSQIIYEQNRKINRKLFWSSFFDYLKVAVILIPIIIGFFYLLPGINNLLRAADVFAGVDVCKDGSAQQGAFLDALLKQLPIDQAKKEQLKALLR
ncbi:MAG TPA: hypothetical protein P5230_03650 [Candidatus Magasanikbacteria bacterium]|nr:hypothetical protein [Candidatus Magasanikbacteria bacterium]